MKHLFVDGTFLPMGHELDSWIRPMHPACHVMFDDLRVASTQGLAGYYHSYPERARAEPSLFKRRLLRKP